MEVIFENIKYHLDTDKKTAEVKTYLGYSIDVIIPEFIDYGNEKYKVTSIGFFAFGYCDSLTSITIGNSVTKFDENAFYNCINLTSITIGNSVIEIGNNVFQGCSSLESITIPNSVTYIGDRAFYNCKRLTSVTIGNSVTKIGNYTFAYCTSLTSITIPNSVTFIGNYAFCFCNSLSSITIPNSVTYIGIVAFGYVVIKTPKRYTKDGKLIAYKTFNVDMTCRDFQYEEGKTYEIEGEIKCCIRGFHACTNPLDIFNYYDGEICEDFVMHEVYLSGDIDEDNKVDSKVCASKIEIGKRLTIKDINDIINRK